MHEDRGGDGSEQRHRGGTARRLAAAGFDVVVGARRLDRLQDVAREVGGRALPLDVTDTGSVEAFAAQVPECSVLVNNAGGALGLTPLAEADDEQWRWMYDVNVLGIDADDTGAAAQADRQRRRRIVNVGSSPAWRPTTAAPATRP